MKENINVKESNKALMITGIIIAILVIGLFTNGFGLFNGKNPGVKLEISNSPVLGNENAPVTIYEFSDFSCPFCAAADGKNPEAISSLRTQDASWQAPVPNIIKDYVETGKAKLVFKYFPGHGMAQYAHVVGLCLNEQDLFWEFHDLAFENQDQLSSIPFVINLTKQVNADQEKLNFCLSNNNYTSQLTNEKNMGLSSNIQGTPTFIVNGKLVSGAVSYSTIKKTIDASL